MVVKARLEGSGEFLRQGGQHLLGDAFSGSCLEVDHSGVFVDIDNLGQVGRVLAGKDIHLQAALAEPSRELGDIDVQTPGVSHARRGEWRRMHADHGHSLRIFDACAHLDLR